MGAEDSGSGNYTGNDTTTPWPSGAEIASQAHWIISLVLDLMIIFANLWITVSFIHHAVSTKVLQKKKSRRDVNGGLVLILAMIAVTMPFFRYFGTLSLLFVSLDRENGNGCENANDVCVAGFGLALLPTYAFLWSRQRAFYGHPSLGHMFGTCVSVFSNISIVLIVLTAGAAVILGIYPVEYRPGPGGCVLIGGNEEGEWRSYIYALVMIASQLVLLGLFLHPIRIHARNQSAFDSNANQSTKPGMSEVSSMDGLSTTAYKSATSSEDGQHNSTAFNGNTEITQYYPSPNKNNTKARSQSMPTNHHLRRIANELEPHRKSSVDSDPGKTTRAYTVEHGSNADVRKKSAQSVRNTVSKFTRRFRSTTMRSRKIYRLIKRVLILAVVSIVSDLVAMLLNQFVIPDNIPQTYAYVMFDFSILINVTTIVLSFENWRTRLLSPCSTKMERRG